MSLATRCPACGTIFRVVQDQLKVSEGWVRCGQCHEVFHGIEALFDLDNEPELAARRPSRPAQAPGKAATPPAGPAAVRVPPAPPVRPSAPAQIPAPVAMQPGFNLDPGFTPATSAPATVPAPVPAAPRMAPRFAARLAEESARRQATRTPATDPEGPPPPPAVFVPTQPAAPEAKPSSGITVAAPVTAPPVAFAPAPSAFMPPPPTPEPATEPAAFAPPTPFVAHSGPEAFPQAPAPAITPAAPVEALVLVPPPLPVALPPLPEPEPEPEPELTFPELPGLAEVRHGVDFDIEGRPPETEPTEPMPLEPLQPAPARQPRTIGARAAESSQDEGIEAIVVDESFARHLSETRTARPGRLANDADDDSDRGPLTLASMLPDAASDWPEDRPKTRRRRRSKNPPPASSEYAASQLAAEKSEAETQPGEVAPREEPGKDARFLREARRGARWKKPWVRGLLGVALVSLVGGATAQLAWPMRDDLAARYPATRPAWDGLCARLGCTIEAPRALASLSLDSSSLTRTGTEHVLLFTADLHNRSGHEVRTPSFELTFMDLNGNPVARKVLGPEQIGLAQKSLRAEAELHVHARLQVDMSDANGFRAELFYP